MTSWVVLCFVLVVSAVLMANKHLHYVTLGWWSFRLVPPTNTAAIGWNSWVCRRTEVNWIV